MKKRFISILLSVLMVMSLFQGISINTYADATSSPRTIEYTLAEGDYALKVCQNFGLNYYTCKQAIMILNNISEGTWGKLTVGKTIILPASDYDAILIENGSTAQTQPVSTSTVTTAKSKDTVAYYLVPYTMTIGDTVSGVCANLGVNFNIFHEFIRQVNQIESWTKVRAGQNLLIPTPVTPGVGTSCYAVMCHKVQSGETAYGLAASNGIDYNTYRPLLQTINLTGNLSSIGAGSNFYYPTRTNILYPGTTSSPGTTTTTTTTTTTDGSVTTTTTTVTTTKAYKLTSNLSSSDGTMVFYVGNKPVNEARAGDVVTIVSQTNANKAIESLTLKHLDGSADLKLTGDSFIMPACDVRVDALIKTGHDITIQANYSNKATATVGGVSVSSAVKGAAVTVVSTDPTFEIENVYAYYKRFSWLSTKTPLTLTGNSFVMPDMDVTVEVTLKPVTTYSFYVNTPVGGSFFLQVDGTQVTRAAKGVKVTVVPKALEGYEPAQITVTQHGGGATVNVFNNTFTMPGFDVDVNMRFAGKGNNIVIMPSEGGSVTSNPANEAATGALVTLTATPAAGFTLNRYDIVRNSDGLMVNVTGGNQFIMPEGGVTVTPIFVGNAANDITAQMYINSVITGANYAECSFYASYTNPVNGSLVKGEFRATGNTSTAVLGGPVPNGVYVDLRDDSGEGIAFVKYVVRTNGTIDEVLTNEANFHGYFQMPGAPVTIEAYFETGKIAIGPAAVTGTGTVSYRSNGNSVITADPGDVIEIILTGGVGYAFDYAGQNANLPGGSKLVVTRKDNGAVIPLTLTATPGYTFTMPAEGVNIQVIFDPQPFVINMRTRDENGTNLNGQGFWQIAVNGVVGVVDNDPTGTTVNVNYGDTIVVAMTEAGYSKYDLTSFTINGYEYVADVLNYFYNFVVEGQRAQNLDIVATLRPKVPYETVFHSLSASYDVTKGNVEFLLLNVDPRDPVNGAPSSTYSTAYQGTVVPPNSVVNAQFVKNAFAGDWVAIVAGPNNREYVLDVDNITITGSDATRIVPIRLQGWNVGGMVVDLFVFRMPDTDVNIGVNFTGVTRRIAVRVIDQAGNPVAGMVRLSTDGQVYRDVAGDATFDGIGYGTTVYIMRTELAMSQNKSISSFLVNALRGDGTTAPVSYINLSQAFQFTMPDDNVLVNIQIGDGTFSVATPIVSALVNGRAIMRNINGDIITEAQPGQDVYVTTIPNDGFQQLQGDELTVLGANGMNIAEFLPDPTVLPTTIATLLLGDPHSSTGVWHFVMPQGGASVTGTFKKDAGLDAGYSLTFSISGGNAQISSLISGVNVTKPIQDGDSVNVSYGQVIYIAPDDGYTWSGVGIQSAKAPEALSKLTSVIAVYTVPDLSAYNNTDTLALTLAPQSVEAEIVINAPQCTAVLKNADTGAVLAGNPNVGDNVLVELSGKTGYSMGDVTVTRRSDDSVLTGATASGNKAAVTFTVPEGGVTITAECTLKTPTITFNISAPSGSPKVSVKVDGETVAGKSTFGNGEMIQITYGQKLTITPPSNYTWDGEPTSDKGKCELSNGVLSYTTSGNDATITITLKAKS